MKKLKQMIKKLDETGRLHLIKDYLEDVRPFVFARDDIYEGKINFEEKDLDLPFSCVSFEISGEYATLIEAKDSARAIPCLFVYEIKPRHYKIFAYFMYDGVDDVTVIDSKKDNDYFKALAPIINNFLKRIRHGKVGKEEGTPIRFKSPNNPKKKISVVKEHVYVVAPKKSYERAFPGRKIDWSQHFEVRGHWRKINGIGKDREGNYCEEGNTWVVPHTKGDKSKPLIKKQRIVN